MNNFENKVRQKARMAVRDAVQDTISNSKDLEWVELDFKEIYELELMTAKILDVLNLPRNPKRTIEGLPSEESYAVRYVITTPELGILLGNEDRKEVCLNLSSHGFIDFEYEIFSELLLPMGVFYVIEDTDDGTKVIKKAKINF